LLFQRKIVFLQLETFKSVVMSTVALNGLLDYLSGTLTAEDMVWLTEQLKRRIHNGDTVAPYTSEELHARISKSEQDYSEGRYTSHEDLFASLLDQNIQKAV